MSRSFAIVPAAGLSTRMGQPKLLLVIDGRPLIAHTLAAWKRSRVDRVFVVVPKGDEQLAQIVRESGAEPVIPPLAPPDMKASLGYGLSHIAGRHQPTAGDTWLVAPADMPGLSPRVIDALLDRAADVPGRILIPTLGDRRGHPVLLPWSLAAEVPSLAPDEGLSALIDRRDPLLVPCDGVESQSAAAFADLDTPGDLARFRLPGN